MPECKYDLVDDHGRLIASDLDMEIACIFLKALMREYHSEEEIAYTIRRHIDKTVDIDLASQEYMAEVKKNWASYADQLKSE